MENTKLCVLPVSKSVWMKICQNTNTRSSNMNNSPAGERDSSSVREDDLIVTQVIQFVTQLLLTKSKSRGILVG